MKKRRRIKFEEEFNEQLAARSIHLFKDEGQAMAAIIGEAEVSGVSPGAIMASTPGRAITGTLEGDGGVIEADDAQGNAITEVFEPAEEGPVAEDVKSIVSPESNGDAEDGGDSGETEGPGEVKGAEALEGPDDEPGIIPGDLKDKTKGELVDIAKEMDIPSVHKMNKSEIIEAIEHALGNE